MLSLSVGSLTGRTIIVYVPFFLKILQISTVTDFSLDEVKSALDYQRFQYRIVWRKTTGVALSSPESGVVP